MDFALKQLSLKFKFLSILKTIRQKNFKPKITVFREINEFSTACEKLGGKLSESHLFRIWIAANKQRKETSNKGFRTINLIKLTPKERWTYILKRLGNSLDYHGS